jgi:MFS superfamily sulfate permease-like transporter
MGPRQARLRLKPLLLSWGLQARLADGLAKAAPVGAISLAAVLTWFFQWAQSGVKIVGTVPQGLPPLTWPVWDLALWRELAIPALLISVVGFVESVSVGQTLATCDQLMPVVAFTWRHSRPVPSLYPWPIASVAAAAAWLMR